MQDELYSADLGRRHKATLGNKRPESSRRWPIACGGAANAFLALLGPSMGGARPGESLASGGADRPLHEPM